MEKNWVAMLEQANELSRLIETNEIAEKYGLTLSEEDAKLIMEERRNSLKDQQRIEFGEGILSKLIYEFCDSAYIQQSDYVETIIRLQDIFYLYKNETLDDISDDDLLHFMKEQFETVCYGDLDYLEETCLNNFAQAVRAGNGEWNEL